MLYIYLQTLLSGTTYQIFFEPVKFNFELAYLAVQFFFESLVIFYRLGLFAVKGRNHLFLRLALPVGDLIRMYFFM